MSGDLHSHLRVVSDSMSGDLHSHLRVVSDSVCLVTYIAICMLFQPVYVW